MKGCIKIQLSVEFVQIFKTLKTIVMKYLKNHGVSVLIAFALILNFSCGRVNINQTYSGDKLADKYEYYSKVELFMDADEEIPHVVSGWYGWVTLKITYIGYDRPKTYNISADVPEGVNYEVGFDNGSNLYSDNFPMTEVITIQLSCPRKNKSGEILPIKFRVKFPKQGKEKILIVPVRVE